MSDIFFRTCFFRILASPLSAALCQRRGQSLFIESSFGSTACIRFSILYERYMFSADISMHHTQNTILNVGSNAFWGDMCSMILLSAKDVIMAINANMALVIIQLRPFQMNPPSM